MHDRNGTPLKVGDEVVIKARIAETYAAEDYCNARIEVGFEAEHGPANVTGSLTLNTRQLLLVKKAPEQPAA